MLTADRLTLADLAPILQSIVKDKSYRASELGQLVGRYIRWFRNEWCARHEACARSVRARWIIARRRGFSDVRWRPGKEKV